MVQEIVEEIGNIPRNSEVNTQTENTQKEILKWLELFEQVEKLSDKLVLQKANDLNIPWLIEYYILLDGKKVAYFSYRKENWNIELINFATANAKNNIEEIKKESQLLYEKMEELDDIEKIPFLWMSSLLKVISFLKGKTNLMFFSPSLFSIRKNFYKKSLKLFQEQWVIKDWTKYWRDYIVNFN